MVTKIMPLGASNTYGMYQDPTSPGGYRGPLYDLLKAKGASFDFVGLDKDGTLGDADHNGYSGKPIDWFTKPVNEGIYDKDGTYSHTINSGTQTAAQYMISQAGLQSTDVILLLVGTNDVRLGDSADTMLAQIQVLLDQIVTSTASPLVQLMKLQPIGGDYWKDDGDPDTTNNETIAAFNAGLEKLVADKYGALGVTLVDSGVTETTGLSTDGVHMDKTGYEMMAKAWLDSLTAKGQVEGLSSSTSSSPTKPTNEINGDGGANTLTGTNGDDIINGYGGNDILRGEFGADMLNGGTGKDTMYGGASDGASDVFIFTSSADSVVGTKRDTIYDFEAKTDDLDLRGITAQVAEAGQVFKLGAGPQKYSVWYTEGRSETFVRADVNGDTKADFEIRLAGLKGMTADDFILV